MLLPYDSRDQATSGVLVEAVAAGIPVVATGFPHAVELLGGGAGLIARHEDPESMAAAIRTIVAAEATATAACTRPRSATRTTRRGPSSAEQYRAIAGAWHRSRRRAA